MEAAGQPFFKPLPLSRQGVGPDDADFVKAEFIDGIKSGVVDFHYKGKNKFLFDNITVNDTRWIASWLGKLSDEQLKDAFRAANYSPEQVDELAQATRERINLLVNIGR